MHKEGAFFVVRAKENLGAYSIAKKSVKRELGIIADDYIHLAGPTSSKNYPKCLRFIQYHDDETDKDLSFLTNNFKISALTVAKLYKHRWFIELFFKWIKQHLKVKSFWGYSENAVRTQVWIAIATYAIIAIAKKKLNIQHSLYEILQVVSISAFDRTPLVKVFTNENYQDVKEQNYNQLILF